MLREDSARNRLLGIGLISITFLCFAVLDTTAKWLVQRLPVIEVVWLRFVGHVLFTGLLLGPRHGRALVRVANPGLQLLRGGMLFCMTALNFWALQYLQLAETGAIQFAVPLLIALFGAWLLHERLDVGRWLAIATGFVGVLLIVRPGTQGFHPAILLSVGNAVLYALFNLLTRRLAATDRPEATQFLSALAAACLLTPFGIAFWRTPESASQWGLIAVMGIFGGLGHWLLAVAHRFAPATVLAPFLYQQIVWMTLLGWWVFGDVPGWTVVLGTGVVVASGLYLIARERAGPTLR
ncbi:MAG: DMT family transporter [Burkholderiales bacterium]|nr:MAG: DMT family transporter [Burkholderiales bacterium]